MSFEHRSKKVLPLRLFLVRQARFGLYTAGLLTACLLVGMIGYHVFNKLIWMDALLNASMILTGMGPIDRPATDVAKLFSSFYAIFSGIAFPTLVAVFLSPLVHRLLHKLHVTYGQHTIHSRRRGEEHAHEEQAREH